MAVLFTLFIYGIFVKMTLSLQEWVPGLVCFFFIPPIFGIKNDSNYPKRMDSEQDKPTI